MTVSGAVTVLIGLPVVPLAAFADSPQPAVYGAGAETVGRSQLAATVGRVHPTLPPAERGAKTIVARTSARRWHSRGTATRRAADRDSGYNAYHRWGRRPRTVAP